MNRWIDGLSTATPPPSSLTPPTTTEFTDSNTFLPRKENCQRGMSLLRIRISCPTGILVFFGMEEFVRNGGRRQPSRVDSEQRPHVNVDVNVDLCSALSCELVGILSNLKR